MTLIKWLQSRLTAHGFSVGLIDGIDGPLTRRSMEAFQRAHGLPGTGTATPETITALRASATASTPRFKERDTPRVPGPSYHPAVWPRQQDVSAFYGAVGERQTRVDVPWDMRLAWDKGTRIKAITLHEKVAESAGRVLAELAETYSNRERVDLGLDLFGGSLNVRRMRGGSAWSMHSWGIAIDFDPERNQLRWGRPRARLSHPDAKPFWAAWEAEGWVSLGRQRDYDWMHVQAARL